MKSSQHPNRIPFEGDLTRLDVPSDVSPSGARGHRVILTTEAARDALDSLIGMAVGFASGWERHNARQKCGVITDAWIEEDRVCIKGYIYGRDFPEVVTQMRRTDVTMGMSFELADAHVEDMRAVIFTLTKVTFTGAAILLQNKAAYKSTIIKLSAEDDDRAFDGTLIFVGEGRVKLAREGVVRRIVRRIRSGRRIHS